MVTLFAFGSFATSKERRRSDIDLAVLLDPGVLKDRNTEAFKNEYYGASPDFSLRSVDYKFCLLKKSISLPLKRG